MLVVLLLILRSLLGGLGRRHELMLENLALRHQLQVALRTNPRPRLRPRDRALWLWLSPVWPGWRQHLQVVQPETVLRWHRKGSTASRSVLGYMNEMVRYCRYAMAGELRRWDLDTISRELRRDLHLSRQRPGYFVPIDLMRKRVASSQPDLKAVT